MLKRNLKDIIILVVHFLSKKVDDIKSIKGYFQKILYFIAFYFIIDFVLLMDLG